MIEDLTFSVIVNEILQYGFYFFVTQSDSGETYG